MRGAYLPAGAFNLHLFIGIINGGVIYQVPYFQVQRPTQRDEHVQGRGELNQLNALDGGLLHIGDVTR